MKIKLLAALVKIGIRIGHYTVCADREIDFVIESIHGRRLSKEKRSAIRKDYRDDFEAILSQRLAKLAA